MTLMAYMSHWEHPINEPAIVGTPVVTNIMIPHISDIAMVSSIQNVPQNDVGTHKAYNVAVRGDLGLLRTLRALKPGPL